MGKIIYTIGHSTRKISYFLDLLQAYKIEMLVDVRTIPKSRHNPQYNSDILPQELKPLHIRYKHLPELGGLRHAHKDSINTGWENLSFRGYADYMQTDGFWEGLDKLETIAEKHTTAIMCAEAVPWRCHRSLIADALAYHKWRVYHINSKITAKLHKRTPFLHIKKGVFIYKESTMIELKVLNKKH